MAAINVHFCGGKRMQVSAHTFGALHNGYCISQQPRLVRMILQSAAEIIKKKRARLTPENANLLIFLKENQNFTEWE